MNIFNKFIKRSESIAPKTGKASSKKPRKAPKERPLMPILCRPGDEMSVPLYLAGWILRSLVLFCGTFGLTLFIGDAFGIYGEGRPGSIMALFLASLALTVICSAAAWNTRTRIIVPILGAGAGIGILALFTSDPFGMIWEGIRCIFNTAMYYLGTSVNMSLLDLIIEPDAYAGSPALVMGVGCTVLAAIIAVILALSLLRKVHKFTAILLCVIIITPIFFCNLTNGKAGISMVMIFIFSELSLLFYEKKFSNIEAIKLAKKEKKAAKKKARLKRAAEKKAAVASLNKAAMKAYAITLELTEDKKEASAAKAAVYSLNREKKKKEKLDKKKAAKLAKNQAKEAKKAERKAKAAEKKAQKAALAKENANFKNLSQSEQAAILAKRKEKKQAKLDARREKLRIRAEKETSERKSLSASGYAGGTAVIAAALAVWLPFTIITGEFITIKFIDDPVSVVRAYVTAYIKGDDIDLNSMNDVAELTPRTLTYDSPEYTGMEVLAVETERTDPVYLRGWIGMRFDGKTGTWTSGTREDVIEYRELFSKDFTPDMLKTDFIGYLFPTAVLINDTNPILRFADYGFDVRQVHLRRINGESLLVYVPPAMNTDLGIMEYGSLSPNKAKNSAYFDAIYSSRFFDKDVYYSTISFMNKLNDPDVADGLTGSARYFNLFLSYAGVYENAKAYLENQGLSSKEDYDTGRGIISISVDDYSEIDRLFTEECEKLGYPYVAGDSLLVRYMGMSDEEKAEITAFIEAEEKYREWAYLHYSSSVYSNTVTETAKSILKEAGYVRDTKKKDIIPVYNDKNGKVANQHDVVMTVINYLRENFTYTLEPAPYSGNTEMSVLDSFLSVTKNGYCTHFATAAATLLREYGYTVRYCEGYLVDDFERNFTEGAPAKYKGIAHDDNAHAWIEVYYPIVGWVAYETVPDYMEAMYDHEEVEEGTPPDDTPGGDEIIEDDPKFELPEDNEPEKDEPETEETEPAETEEEELIPLRDKDKEKEPEEEPVDQMMLLLIVTISIVSGLILFFIGRLIIRHIMKKAENVVAERHRHIVTAMDTELLQTGKIDTVSIAKEFDDTILRLFGILGYPPMTGEQYSEYAARLEDDFGGMTDYSLSQIFDLVAKTEFGGGLTPEEMYILADFTDRLTVSAYAGLTRFEKIKYRYIKRII